jgi:ABC-type proline/glycine betaine transport system substrate-binding protein
MPKGITIHKRGKRWVVWVYSPHHIAGVFDTKNEAQSFALTLDFYGGKT